MKFFVNFKEWWHKEGNWLWVICGIFSIIVGIIAYNLPQASENKTPEILISISGSLATIFALVFTITILLSEILKKRNYMVMDRLVHNRKFIFTYIFFFLGVIYPLLVIKTDINPLESLNIENSNVANLSVAISIAIMAFGILLLLPFSMEIFNIVKYDAFQKLSSEIKDNLSSDKKRETEEIINELSDLGEDFIKNNYEYARSFVIPELKDCGIKVVEKEWVKATEYTLYGLEKIGMKAINQKLNGLVTSEIFQCITEIGMKATDKKLMQGPELPVAFSAINALGNMGIKAIDNELNPYIISFSTLGLLKIGCVAANNELEYFGSTLGFMKEVRNRLIEVGLKANEKDKKDITKVSMKYLWVLSAYVERRLPNDTVNWVEEIKADLRANSLNDTFEAVYQEAEKFINDIRRFRTGFPIVENELNEIKRLWDAT